MAITVTPVAGKQDLKAFVRFPKELYRGSPHWVPPFDTDYRAFFAQKHPFFAHAKSEFLLARSDSGAVVGRVMMIRNDRYNREHNRKAAQFYFLDFLDDSDVSSALFRAMETWTARESMETLMGPMFSGATFGAGILIEGYDRPAPMTMMGFNHAYYREHIERLGYGKRFDLLCLDADPSTFAIPDRVEKLADFARKRGRFKVLQFRNKRDLKKAAPAIAALYNPTLADHPENYPLTDAELDQVTKDLLLIAEPDLEKIIAYDDEVVGFSFAFPDATQALQRAGGKLSLRSILDLLRTKRTTRKLILNGMGILEKYQRLGGNALIYSELSKTLQGTDRYTYDEAELVQINETTDLMLADMFRLGATICKRHRVYDKQVQGEQT